MGVSGSGKSTVGRALAVALGWDFVDGDDLHTAYDKAKMAAGQALTDADRAPWLGRAAAVIDEHRRRERPLVMACSALKRAYRDVLRRDAVLFVYLSGARGQLDDRLRQRVGHFMPAALLDSQLATLEPPDADENAITVDIDATTAEMVERIRTALAR